MLKALMTQEGYRRTLRSPVRGLWTGVLSYDEFFGAMMTAIRGGFTAAWRSGAQECGIQPDEYSDEEKQALQTAIVEEYGYIGGFATAIEEGSKKNGGKLEPLFRRSELWMKRYLDLQNRAKQMACGNAKLAWRLGQAEHCPSCVKLANQVRRANVWREKDVRPQHPTKLKCMISSGGPSACKCRFEVTEEPCSRGPLPRLP